VTSVPETALVRATLPRARARTKPGALPAGFEELRARLARTHRGDAPGSPSTLGTQATRAPAHVRLVPVTTTLTGSARADEPAADADPRAARVVSAEPPMERSEPAAASARSLPLVLDPPAGAASPAPLCARPERSVAVEEPVPQRAAPAQVPPALSVSLATLARASGPAAKGAPHAAPADSTLVPEAAAGLETAAPKGTGTASPAATPSPVTPPPVVVISLPHAVALRHEGSVVGATTSGAPSTGVADPPASLPLPLVPSAVLQVLRQGALPRAVTLHLEPKELGEVQLQVQAVGTDIHVQIGARNPETRMLVGSLLEDLAQQLSRDLGSGGGKHRDQPAPRPGAVLGPPAPRATNGSSVEFAASGLVDLRL
jgi:hypothetical protein